MYDSLHLILAVITYSQYRQQTNSEICSVIETQMSSWCQKITMMLPEGYGFSSKIEIINHAVKGLQSGSERFFHSLFLVSCFYKFPVVIQEAFTE